MTAEETSSLHELFADAIVIGDDACLEAVTDAGPKTVEFFRAYLAGEHRIELPRVGDPRPYIDSITELSSRLASHFPETFLATFNSQRWAKFSYILIGLGYTGRAEAKPLLCQVLRGAESNFDRMYAAISLGHLPGADAVDALMVGIKDPDSLVQHHSIRSLAQIGDRETLDLLLAIAADPPTYGNAIVTPDAAANLAQRLGVSVQIPRPDVSKWLSPNPRPCESGNV